MGAKPKRYAAGLYLRLSKDDEGAGESASIGTQRKMLYLFASERGFDVYGEYVDDGWSGTNFNRPGWNRMIEDIENKKINLVITKDLSRLGRNYITAGEYTEIYFPSKGVRYIAVNDGYDSDSPYTDIVPFKNVINELYARDTSKKIRSALRTKMQEGAFIGNFAPYGYQKDPENKNRLVVDPIAAPTVQEIFRMAEEGLPPAEIAKSLNRRGVLTPAAYRASKHGGRIGCGYPTRTEWTSAAICKMLCNVVYLGRVAQGKTTKVSFKSSLAVRNPRDEWIVVPDMHDPIIAQETFDRVRRRSVSRRAAPKGDFKNVFSGIAKCADCGRGMSVTGSRRSGSSYNLVCGGYKLYGSRECSNHFMDYGLLCQIVLEELRFWLARAVWEPETVSETVRRAPRPKEKPHEAAALQQRVRELDRIIARLYEDQVAGRLEESRFFRMLEGYEAEQRELSTRLQSGVATAQERADGLEAPEDLAALFRRLAEPQELTSELVRTLIDRIEIGQGAYDGGTYAGQKRQTARIFYKFALPPGQPERAERLTGSNRAAEAEADGGIDCR